MTLSGATTLAQLQTAMDAVTYQNTSDTPNTSSRTLTWSVTEGDETGSTTSTINVALVSDPPVITTSTTATFNENGAPEAISPTVTITDGDTNTMSGATVAITGNYQSGEDVLAFTNQNGISGSFDSGTGVLTLSGDASIANYETALESVTYQDTANEPNTATRTIAFTVSENVDQLETSAASNTSVTVNDTADSPTVTGGNTLNYNEGSGALTIDSGITLTIQTQLILPTPVLSPSLPISNQEKTSWHSQMQMESRAAMIPAQAY